MTDPAEALAARIERFEQAADPELIWDSAALLEAEQAMRACAGDRSDAVTWRLIGMLHLARYRLDQHNTQDAAVAGAFFAAVAVVAPERLPEKLRGSGAPPGESADTWAGLVEEVLRLVDPAAYRHVGLLIHALVRRAMEHPTPEVSDRLGHLLLQESMRAPDPSWAPGALELLGTGLVRLYTLTGEREVIDDAVHVLFRAALGGSGENAYPGELAAALGLAAAEDDELVRTYLAAAEAPARGQDRSQALLTLVDLTQARSAASYADGDLLAFIRVGQCALDFWHEQWAHPAVLAPYAAGLIEWFVVTGDERSLEAGVEMLEALRVTPGERARGLGGDHVVRLGLLGERRWSRYGVTGDLADLDVALDVLREAAGLAAPDHPERPRLLTDLAGALLRRAVVTGGDPAEPIAAARAALAAHDERDPERATSLLLLARSLKLDLTARSADEAVAALREALVAGERLSVRAEAYGLVSEVLRWRAAQEDGPSRAEDLDEAVRSARHGVELAVKTSRDQLPAQRTLCTALLARFSAQGDPRDLGEVLALARDGDAALPARFGTVLDAVLDDPPPVDEQLAQAATELALLTSDEDVALKLLRLAERQAETSAGRGEFLLGTATHLAGLGRLRVAGVVLERAAAAFGAAGLRERAAYALSRQGSGLEELGEPERALEAYGRSAAVHREAGDPGAEALQLGSMGAVHFRAGEPVRAVEHHLRAIALCEGAGLAAEEAAHQENAARAYLAAGEPAGAVACAARARELYLELGETEAAAMALVHAARAAVDQDDLTAAGERIAACAIELEAAGAWEAACGTLDAQAVLLAGRGHRAQAAACENRLVEIVRRRGRRREPADEWYRVAQRRRGHGDAAGARLAFELAGREYESIAHYDGAGSVRYNLGVLAYAEGEPRRALEEFGAAAETFGRLRAAAKEAVALTMRASCLAALDRAEDALPDLDRALELAAVDGDLEALLTATLGRAALDVELGELQKAGERLSSALGLTAGDALKEAVVRDRMAALARRTGDLEGRVEALERSMAGFRDSGQDRLAALGSIKLGFALEERGEFRRARAALEEGLAGLEAAPELRPAGAPFEVVAAMGGGLDAETLSRLAAIQLTAGDLTGGRATLAQALTSLRAGGRRPEAAERLRIRLRLEEAEAAGDLAQARTLAEHALADPSAPNGHAPDPASLPSPFPTRRPPGPETLPAPRLTAVPAHDPADRSYLLAKLSAYCLALGDPAAAHAHAAHGYGLRDERAVEHLRNLGNAARALGRPEEAVEHLSKAVELARDAGAALPALLAGSLAHLAAALTDQARWREAGHAYEEGLSLIEAPVWRALRAPLLTGRAALHLELGELDQATTRYRQAVSLKEELADTAGLAEVYAGLSLAHELNGAHPEALRHAKHAADLARTQPDRRGAVLTQIALARLETPPLRTGLAPKDPDRTPTDPRHPRRMPDEATPSERVAERLGEALATAREIGYRAGEAIALSHLGALDLTTASYARARNRLSTAIDLLTELGHDLELATACHHRSIAAEELGDLPDALADAERACALGHEPARARAIRLAAHLGHGLTAWTLAETAHAIALSTHLTPPPRPSGPGTVPFRPRLRSVPDPETTGHGRWSAPHGVPGDLAEAERRAADAIRTLMTAARNTRDPERAALLIHQARTARADLETLRDRMEPLAPDHVALRRATPPDQTRLDALVNTPGETIGLLSFHICAEPSTAGARTPTGEAAHTAGERIRVGEEACTAGGETWAVGEGTWTGEDAVPRSGTMIVLAHRTGWPEPRAFPTTVDDALLADFLHTIDGRRPDLVDVEARRRRADLWRTLADRLLSDATAALGDDLTHLHLFPHGALHRVPLHALAPGGRPLIERFPVTYAPSAAVLSRLTHRAPARGGGSLAIGFTPDPAERAIVEAEAEEAATTLGTHPATGQDATSALLPGSWDIVHLACHGRYDDANPLDSGIRLADGLLTAADLMAVNIDARLVILSGHERDQSDTRTAGQRESGLVGQGGTPSRHEGGAAGQRAGGATGVHEGGAAGVGGGVMAGLGEGGMAGLGYALLHAGARSALLTLWPVSAEITRALMRDLHTRLRDGMGQADALRAAVLGLRELYGPAEPDLWAAYVLIGLPGGS
ncbi:CHAT domain-containing protein [Nonomuraea sp. NPDC050643]|uniref:CHAT domain-containing protein n=1 Tax=Nonomuraea sp. NPDC050643 TaxID=3155660 RepID=UPI0033D81FE1